MDDTLINQLEGLGLTRNEAKIYLTMLGRAVFKASEIAQAAEVPRPKVYEALSKLVEMGLCFAVPGNVAQYSATPPAEALPNWQKQRELRQASELQKQRDLVETLADELQPLHESGQVETAAMRYVDVLYERARVSQVANDLLASAKHTILVLEKEPYAQDPRTLNAFEVEALQRGVSVRCVFEQSVRGLALRAGPLQQAGASVRVLPYLPMKLIVADNLAAICAMRDPITGQQSLTSLRIQHPDFAQAMQLLFESLWDTAQDLQPHMVGD